VGISNSRYFPITFSFRHIHGPCKELQIQKATQFFRELYPNYAELEIPKCIKEIFEHDFFIACPLSSIENM